MPCSLPSAVLGRMLLFVTSHRLLSCHMVCHTAFELLRQGCIPYERVLLQLGSRRSLKGVLHCNSHHPKACEVSPLMQEHSAAALLLPFYPEGAAKARSQMNKSMGDARRPLQILHSPPDTPSKSDCEADHDSSGQHLLEAALHKAPEAGAEAVLKPGRRVLGNQEQCAHGVQLCVGGRPCRHLHKGSIRDTCLSGCRRSSAFQAFLDCTAAALSGGPSWCIF